MPERTRGLKNRIFEETGPKATIDALLFLISRFRISLPRAREDLSGIERAVSRWRESGRALGRTDRELEPFTDAIEHPERQAAQLHWPDRFINHIRLCFPANWVSARHGREWGLEDSHEEVARFVRVLRRLQTIRVGDLSFAGTATQTGMTTSRPIPWKPTGP